MKTIILDRDPNVAEILKFTLDSMLGSESYIFKNADETMKRLKEDTIDLIIIESSFLNIVKVSGLKIPYILLTSSNDGEFEGNGELCLKLIKKPNIFDGVKEGILKFKSKNINIDVDSKLKNQTYVSVSIDLLKSMDKVPCDLFLKIGEQKIVKMYPAGIVFDQEQYQKVQSKNIKGLLVKAENAENFAKYFEETILRILKNENLSEESKLMSVQTVILNSAKSFGISESVMQHATQTVELVKTKLEKDRQFKKILSKIFEAGDNYISQHSIALMYISIAILKKSELYTQELANKLASASLIHDVTLDENTVEDFSKDSDHEALSAKYKQHPSLASDIALSIKDLPQDVDKIVKEHHEKPDGSGFPHGLVSSQIKVISAFFIFSHLVVDAIYKMKNNGIELSMENLKAQLPLDQYNQDSFKKVQEAFLKSELF